MKKKLLSLTMAMSMLTSLPYNVYASNDSITIIEMNDIQTDKLPVARMDIKNEESGNLVPVLNLSDDIDYMTMQSIVDNVCAYEEDEDGTINSLEYSLIIRDDLDQTLRSDLSNVESYRITVVASTQPLTNVNSTDDGIATIIDVNDAKLTLEMTYTKSNGKITINNLNGKVDFDAGTIDQSNHYIQFGIYGVSTLNWTKHSGSSNSCVVPSSKLKLEYGSKVKATYKVKFEEDSNVMYISVMTA